MMQPASTTKPNRWVGGKSDAVLKRTARLADGYFASFQTPVEFAASMAKIRSYAAEYGRANAHIESGLILLCRIAGSREKALDEMQPMISAMGRGAEQFLERSVFGSAEDIIGRMSEYIELGLDKFVLSESLTWAFLGVIVALSSGLLSLGIGIERWRKT